MTQEPIEHPKIPVALSARHVHLSKSHVEALFGPGYQLTKLHALSQPGQFAAKETVEIMGPKQSISKVRVLGPARHETQVELSATDGVMLGLNIPVRLSGDLAGTPGADLIGPRGAVRLRRGCICAFRHIHATFQGAKALGVTDRQKVYLRTLGPRGLIFDEVVVRVNDQFFDEIHLDTDEGNAAGIRNGDLLEVIPSLCRDLCCRSDCSIASSVVDGQTRPFCEGLEENVVFR